MNETHRRGGDQRRPDEEEPNEVAQMAQDGVARSVRAAHTMEDGDTLFALGTGGIAADPNLVGAYGAEAVTQAVVRAVKTATGTSGLPACGDQRAGA